MRSPFATELARSIKGSLGRFLAIAGIAALGCGFYAGLGMTGADMRSAADAFYDDTNLYDVRLVSTLGFGKSQVAEMARVDGVEAVMPAYATDVMATLGGEQYAMRFMSLPTGVATGVAGDATLMYYLMDEAQEGKNAFLEKRDPDFDQFPQFPG